MKKLIFISMGVICFNFILAQQLSVQSYPVTAAATAKTVSLAGLTAGTYVVKLIINGETVDNRQVIKN